MKVRLNVLIIFMLCVVMISAVGVVRRLKDDRGLWTPNDIYTQVGGSTSSSVSSSSLSSSESGVPVRSYTTAPRRRVSSYAPAASVRNNSLIASSPLASSTTGALYTTSSAKVRSFGGGGNAGGVSMSGGQVKSTGSSVAASTGMNVSMPSTSVLARNTKSANAVLPSVSGDIAMASSQAYAGIGNTTKGIAGRKNAPGMGGNLDNWVQDIIGNDGWVWTDGTIDYFDKAKLYQKYLDAIANGDLPEGITWEEFLSWFGDQSSRYAFPIPSGVWFMCFLALGYGLYIAYRRKQKVVNS